MKLTLRTIVVLALGVVVSLGLYAVGNSAFGQLMGPNGINGNFAVLISAWKALGGSAKPLSPATMQGLGGGRPSFAPGGGMGGPMGGAPLGGAGGRRRGGAVAITDGVDLASAPRQTGSDLLWLGIPAALAAGLEILWVMLGRRRRPAVAARP